ncbi:MAG: ABC transporter ATP-binding protein [Lachnospiraceae bacterium]|nr:ABC transporter ATP-binding protein [Lachnospiraceae bacterium]
MIQLDHVEKKLGNFMLTDISLTLPKGYILGLIGRNGAGKTTLLRLLMGLYTADAGKVLVLGANPKTQEVQVKSQIGWVLTEEIFAGGQTLMGNADRDGRYYPEYSPDVFLEYCGRFGLSVKRPLGKLSRGEKLKFQFAFALSHAPKLLLLDEPSANFDPDFRAEFFKIITEFISDGEHGVVLSTHLTADLDRLADYVAMLEDGKLLFCMERQELADSYRIVSGEEYKLRLLPKDRVVSMESGKYGARAFIKHNRHTTYDPELSVSVPTLEEIMFYHAKKK